MPQTGSTFIGLAEKLRGPLLFPDDQRYDDARQLWNAMIDKRPAAIVRASGVADVVDTVNFARETGRLLSVKGNGHNIAGLALADDALTLDLSALKGVHLDLENSIAHVQPGCNWGDVDREGLAFGRTVPGGIVSTTGVAGLALGGGFGWMTRKYGLTSDNIVSMDVVSAKGEFLKASREAHADLFWALCGGGGNFGVVTSFAFHLRAVGPEVMAGLALYPMARAREVIARFREVTADPDEELTALLVLRKAPPAPFLPAEVHGQPVVGIAVCHIGSLDNGTRAVAPIKAIEAPIVDLISPKPFAAHQTLFDAAQPAGRRYYWKSDYFDDLSDDVGEILISHAEKLVSPHSAVLFMQLGGAAARLPGDHSAAGNRDARFVVNVNASWEDTSNDAVNVAWAQAFWEDLHPHANGGVYVNFLNDDEAGRIPSAYGGELMGRLAALKAKYDPDNLFRVNQNIAPSA
jgi:FAD/FMN-containing dehydrogenase